MQQYGGNQVHLFKILEDKFGIYFHQVHALGSVFMEENVTITFNDFLDIYYT